MQQEKARLRPGFFVCGCRMPPSQREEAYVKNRFRLPLLILAAFAVFFHQVASGEEKTPEHIRDLVGLTIPPSVPHKRAGDIPGWESLGGGYIGGPGRSFSIDEGHTRKEY